MEISECSSTSAFKSLLPVVTAATLHLYGYLPRADPLRFDGYRMRYHSSQRSGSGPELVKEYPATCNTWLNRKADMALQVQLKCLESILPLVANLPEVRDAFEDLLKDKVFGPRSEGPRGDLQGLLATRL